MLTRKEPLMVPKLGIVGGSKYFNGWGVGAQKQISSVIADEIPKRIVLPDITERLF